MEEDEYRATYHLVNERRCVFEKTLNAQRGRCARSRHFLLAGREGYACRSRGGHQRCGQVLDTMRRNARFTLGLTKIEGPLPHNKEIRVQAGGLIGLQQQVQKEASSLVNDIATTVDVAIADYGSVATLPYQKLVKAMLAFEGRKKRRR